jgi:HK97 family phage major capsid protein/HK97 family phage prohead protease
VTVQRYVPLDDIQIVPRAKGGDGRTVVAYAAVFNTPTYIRDQDGEYEEQIAPEAFNRSLAERGRSIGVFYNHGRTLLGTPSEMASIPLGSPAEPPRADGKGLLTVSRYNTTDIARNVLDAIQNGDITGQSFTGVFLRSEPDDGPWFRSRDGGLTLVTRQEIALIEYGPTPIPAYAEAAITGVRSKETAMPEARESINLTINLGDGSPVATAERVREPAAEAAPEPAAGQDRAGMMASDDDGDEPAGRFAVDHSAWDGARAMANGAASDDPAAFYRGICAGRRAGDPATQAAWALPYKYHPGDAPNAAGVAQALGRLNQTQGLTNAAQARATLESLSKKIHDADGTGGSSGRSDDPAATATGSDSTDQTGTDAAASAPAATAGPPAVHPDPHADTNRRSTMAEGRMSVAEREARLGAIRNRMNEINSEYFGAVLPDAERAEWRSLEIEMDQHEAAIADASARERFLESLEGRPGSTEPGADQGALHADPPKPADTTPAYQRYASYQQPGTRRAPAVLTGRTDDSIYDLTTLRQRSGGSPEQFRAALRSNAMHAVERAVYPGLIAREKAQETIERLLVHVDDADGTLAQRILVTGSPMYTRAFGKSVARLSDKGLTDGEQRALAMGAGNSGAYAVPFQLDPTVILTSDGAISPLRQISRVEQITGKTWEGVTSAGITVARGSEAAETIDNAPTLAQPTVTPIRVQGFVPFSREVEQDWNALMSEITRMLSDAKDIEEASASSGFVLGDATGTNAGGVVGTLGTASVVSTAGTATLALADLDTLEDALPVRWRARASFMASRTVYTSIRALFTAVASSSGDQWVRPSQMLPAQLRGFNAYEASAMDTSVTTSNKKVLLLGDFSQFLIVDRLGMDVELVPHLFGTTANYPTGQRGIYAIWRNNSAILVQSAFRLLKIK